VKAALSFVLGALALAAPKCPLCLAAYLSLFGVGVVGAGVVAPLLVPLGLALIAAASVPAVVGAVRAW